MYFIITAEDFLLKTLLRCGAKINNSSVYLQVFALVTTNISRLPVNDHFTEQGYKQTQENYIKDNVKVMA